MEFSNTNSTWNNQSDKVEIIKVPCQNCGKFVEITTIGGFHIGCVFCLDCQHTSSVSIGSENFNYWREW